MQHAPKNAKPSAGRPSSLPKQSRFLDLPGEIRNRIYAHVFRFDGYVLIGRTQLTSGKLKKALSDEDLPPKGTRLGCLLTCAPLRDQAWIQPHLLRVCHQLNAEATACFYANITFHFHSMGAINKFLDLAPRDGVQAIQKVGILHEAYGEPRLTEHREWKRRHDRKWIKTCKRIAEEMLGIEKLKLVLRICDWPTQLNLTAAWAKPLLVLKGKDDVEVTLRSISFPEQRLQAASRVVSRALMSEKGLQQAQMKDDLAQIQQLELRGGGRVLDTPPKASKVLVIRPTANQMKAMEKKKQTPRQPSPHKEIPIPTKQQQRRLMGH